VLRLTADQHFGEVFVAPLVVEYARRWPEVQLEVSLLRRKVDLVEEGFDVAFRVGHVDDPALSAIRLGPARVRYCASGAYLRKHGVPRTPRDLRRHQCILATDGAPVRWPFRGRSGMQLVPISGRLRFSSFSMARDAALAGLGIAIFPEFACAADLRRKRLRALLDDFIVDAGSVWLVHPARPTQPARVSAFVDLVLRRLRYAAEP
jgi:DNA-binding transcriptional LysR family regulator